ncbi:MAG: hypothetical protein LN567_00465 [Rickettsia endosymbiont of Graphium doson]|nr:hypothetical protein [Rickettsia endosymbiont of Graphium doson]
MPSPSKQSQQPLKVLKKYFKDYKDLKINTMLSQAMEILKDNIYRLATSPNPEINNNISPEHLEHIKALNQLAIIATTRPYSAVLEYTDKGNSKILISPSDKIDEKNFKESYKLFSNYHEDPNPTSKYNLYEHLYKTKHPYINKLLNDYKRFFIANNENDVKIKEVQELIDKFVLSQTLDDKHILDRFEKFVIWCDNDRNIFTPTEYTKKLVQKYDVNKDIKILPSTKNLPHVEMYGISEITKTIKNKSSEILKINIGLAPNNMYTPSTCAGCTAEIEAIYHDKVQAFVYATSPYNLPVEKKYKLSDNVLNSKNPKVWKSILESKYLNELQERVDYFIKELAPLPEAEDLLNKLSDFKKDIGEAIEGAIDAYNELHQKDIDSLTDSLEKITTKTVAACGSKQKRSVDPCKNVKPLYQPLPDNEHIINQYLDYAFIVATKQGRNLKYMTNLSKLLDETKENYSKVEQRKLDLLSSKASNFRKKYIDENSLKAISKKDFPKQLPALYSNGEHTILLFKENNQYKLYSKSINYNEIFTLKADLTYPALSSFIEQFFSVNSINPHYNCYVLTNPLPKKAINQLNLNPNQISTDYQELAKGKVPGIKNFSEKEILDLSGYNFQNKDIKKLTKINLNKVKTLILDNNNIGINGLEAILFSGNFPNLKELSIRNNKLDIKDAS